MTDDSYNKLIEHSRKWIFDLPESEFLLPLFRLRFTPEEAEFLSKFPHRPQTAEALAALLNIPPEGIETLLEPLIRKGFINRLETPAGIMFSLNSPLTYLGRMPGWKGERTQWDADFSAAMNSYYRDVLVVDFLGRPTKGLRVIPIQKTVADPRVILPYESVAEFVEREQVFSAASCACRHRHNMDPDLPDCKHEAVTCLHFGTLARHSIKYGMSKEITREESLEILARSADAGLIHAMSNTRKGMDTICNCCSCCCMFFESVKSLPPEARGQQPSGFTVTHAAAACKACGLCAKRCPMGSIQLEISEGAAPGAPKTAKLSLSGRCIGCGVCAHKCPTQALKLVKTSEENIPENSLELAARLMAERGRDIRKAF